MRKLSPRSMIILLAIIAFLLISCNVTRVTDLRNDSFDDMFPENEIHIWAKSDVADYLWSHLLNGKTSKYLNGKFIYGFLSPDGMIFEYYGGSELTPIMLPETVKYAILVLDGNTKENMLMSVSWLEYMPKLPYLKKLAVILLGNENCENDWITKYLRSRGGPIDVLFLIYDSPLVDDIEVYQWPLGVTTYLNFPKYDLHKLNLNCKKKFLCNFPGSGYKGSSMKRLRSVLSTSSFKHNCVLADSHILPDLGIPVSLKHYIDILKSSDYTLCPAGINAETNRVYEAMSLGSIPIIEDTMTPGQCVLPLSLLKKYNAPVIFIKDWIDLNRIFARWDNFSLIRDHRMRVAKWYNDFQNTMAQHFTDIINNTFFHSET